MIPNDTPLVFVKQYGAEFVSESMVPSAQDRQLQVKYLVLAMLHLMARMAQTGLWSKSVAVGLMDNKPIGFVKLRYPPAAARDGVSVARKRRGAATVDGVRPSSFDNDTQPPTLGASKRLIDPRDHDFVIEYEVKERRLPCVELLSTALYAIATAAQSDENDYCRDLEG